MAKAPAFQFYPERFTMGCALMSPAEVGCYILMLCHQWEHGGLPNDANALQMLCRSNAPVSDRVMEKFGAGEDGDLRNEALEKVRADQTAYRERIGSARSKAANKRWTDARAYANALQKESTSNATKEVEVGGKEKSSGKERAQGDQLPFASDGFRQAWSDFEEMRKKLRKPTTAAARRMLLSKCERFGEAKAVEALNIATIKCWTDIYDPDQSHNGKNKPEHTAQRGDLKTTW